MKKRGFEETVAETLAELSQGSMGIALEIAEKGLLEELSALVKAFYSSGFEKKFRIAERLARLSQSELELFFYLLRHRKAMDFLARLGYVFQSCGFKIKEEINSMEPRFYLPIFEKKQTHS